MSAWGPGIFSSDTAADVRGDYRELIEDGLSAEEATAEILRQYKAVVNDPDDATAFWTGLAATQFQLGQLQPVVRDRALEVIAEGGDLHLWKGPTKGRIKALDRLRLQLLGPQRAPVRLRRPRPIASPVRAGDVFTLRIEENLRARCRVLAVRHERFGDLPVVELIDEHGTVYMEADTFPEASKILGRAIGSSSARWVVVPTRRKDMPTADELVVVGHQRPPLLGAVANKYLSWPLLRDACGRILSDPDSRPHGRRPRLSLR